MQGMWHKYNIDVNNKLITYTVYHLSSQQQNKMNSWQAKVNKCNIPDVHKWIITKTCFFFLHPIMWTLYLE